MSTTTKNGKNVGYRLLAALFALACVGAFFIPMKVLGYFNGSFTLSNSTFLYKIVLDLVQSELKLFGFLPAFASGATILSVSTTIALYFFVLTLVIGFVTSFIAIFARKKAPALVRFAAFMITLGAAAQTVTLPLITTYYSNLTPTVDLYSLIFTCAFVFFYFVLMLAKLKSGAWIRATQFIITLAVTASLFLAFIVEGHALPLLWQKRNCIESSSLRQSVSFALTSSFRQSPPSKKRARFLTSYVSFWLRSLRSASYLSNSSAIWKANLASSSRLPQP
ncbi:MAG: hypothetical protein IJF44_04960 [Clostridia bacterium]|nr:hypothetical protein [Clostridia bacterium]